MLFDACDPRSDACDSAKDLVCNPQSYQCLYTTSTTTTTTTTTTTVGVPNITADASLAGSTNPSSKDKTPLIAIGGGLAALVVLIIIVVLVVRKRRNRFQPRRADQHLKDGPLHADGNEGAWGSAAMATTIHNAAFDATLTTSSSLQNPTAHAAQEPSGLPKIREIERAHLRKIDTVGKGQFGEVWKAYLDESSLPGGAPGYLVAAKTVATKNASQKATDDLRDEANVMAQLASHPNVLAVVGVITVGYPLVLIMSYCEHGSLLSYLVANAQKGSPLEIRLKLRLGLDVARGMEHLASRSFIHRDLAARNVLVSSELVGIIADFGLSRGGGGRASSEQQQESEEPVEQEHNYYRSQNGLAPVRWTAPEGLSTHKFSTASDVWSFGIVMVEMVQNGKRPYANWKDLDEVAYKVKSGATHDQPRNCPDDLYAAVMAPCWSFEAAARPSFSTLAGSLSGLLTAETAQARAHQPADRDRESVSPDYLDVESEAVHKQKQYQRLTAEVADLGERLETIPHLREELSDTDICSLSDAAAAAELHCGCSLREEVAKALAFAKKFRLSERGKQYADILTIDDIATVNLFTQETELYKMMNSTLGGWGDIEAIKHYLPFVRLLESVLDKLAPVNATVYRGIRLPIKQALGGLTIGDILSWGAFTSTTLSPDVLRDPMFLGTGADLGERVVFVITIVSGTKIMAFSDKGVVSEYLQRGLDNDGGGDDGDDDRRSRPRRASSVDIPANEEEVLLRPGTCFIIDAIVPRDGQITEVQMHEVPSASNCNGDQQRDAVNARQEYMQPVSAAGAVHRANVYDAGVSTAAATPKEASGYEHVPPAPPRSSANLNAAIGNVHHDARALIMLEASEYAGIDEGDAPAEDGNEYAGIDEGGSTSVLQASEYAAIDEAEC